MIDNFKVYSRAMSEAEIAQLLFARLNLARAGDFVMASWAGDLTGYRLQTSPGSWPSNRWVLLPILPQPFGGEQVILIQPSQAKEFLRLARP